MSSNPFESTERNRVRRVAKRASYERENIYQILDQAWTCHVAIQNDEGPVIIPMLHARMGEQLIFHGATSSRLMKYLSSGKPLALSVAIEDGIVLARSLFHHSMNYRSVVVFGTGNLIENRAEKLAALKAISDKVMPERWDDARPPSPNEMKATAVVAVGIDSASAKVRTGGPIDEKDDYSLNVWAGVVPIIHKFGTPVPDPTMQPKLDVPKYVTNFVDQ